MPAPSIDEIVVADPPEPWADVGFALDGDTVHLGGVRIRLAGSEAGRGIVGWALRDVASTELDGIPTARSERPPAEPGEHPNGVTAIDHVVAFSPELDRTVGRLQDAGLDLRRIREEPTPAGAPRQAFFRLGAEILEVIQVPEPEDRDGPSRLWGLAVLVDDIERAAGELGGRCGPVRDAVQDGRRIAPLRRSAGLAVPLALMTPRP